MEIYGIYTTMQMFVIFFVNKFLGTSAQSLPSYILLFWAGLIAFAVWAIAFIFQGFGLYAMAKGQGLKNRWLVFVPFVSTWYMGKVAGECRFFNRKVKNAGVWAMVTQIIAAAVMFAFMASEFYLYYAIGEPEKIPSAYYPGFYEYVWSPTSRLGNYAYWYYRNGEFFFSIIGLVYEIFMFILVVGILKKYTPKNHFGLSILSWFIPVSRGITFFVVRKRKAIDYEAYMQQRREAYFRQQQQYYNRYGNPYNRPYGGMNNPYGQNNGGTPPPSQEPPKQEEPFSEFSSNQQENSGGTGAENSGGKSDDFFD